MGMVIENPATIERVERCAAAMGKSADDVIAEAVQRLPPVDLYGPLSEERKSQALQALEELRQAYQAHRHPSDNRTADRVIGYDENGLPR